MKNKILRKRFTMNYLFVFIGIILLLFFNSPCAAQYKTVTETYKSYVKQADQAFDARDYNRALDLYEKANKAKPEYNYPTDRIEEIKKILADPNAQVSSKPMNSNSDYKSLLAKADYAYEGRDFATALLFYQKAFQAKPDYNYAPEKINEINLLLNASPDSKSSIFENTMLKAESLYNQKNYQQAQSEYQKAALIDTSAQLPKERLNQISAIYIDPDDMGNFNLAIANGDNELAISDFEHAILYYEAALKIHPNAKFVNKKITDAKNQQLAYKAKTGQAAINIAATDKLLQSDIPANATQPMEMRKADKTIEIQQQEEQKKYDAAIASGDQLLSESRYSDALSAYKQALSIKPDEAYPVDKTAEINSILAKQKSDSDNYALAIRTGEKALATGNYTLALTSFQDAQKIKPSELYPVEQITEIKAQISAQQNKDDKYAKVLKTGDQLFVEKEYNGALTAYTEAAELKKNEKYPQDQIDKINKLIADSRSVEDNYAIAINEGDKLSGMKDYTAAIEAYTRATEIKPNEVYPGQRILEIKKIMEETTLARSSEYTKALEVADKLYNTKVFDQAIEAYESAAKMNPGDAYPELQISKIRKYMSDHAILDLNSQALTISQGEEKKFTFTPIDPGSRKNNYILLKARSTGTTVPKVYLNYGKDNAKNGGIVLRSLDKSALSDLLISISIQDKWFREENNWISISVETGAIEISRVQIAAGE